MDTELLKYQTVRETGLYKKLGEGSVECQLCERRCMIPAGDRGYCKTRANIKGVLYTLVYGYLTSCESRPIEIKPFNHYWPGSTALTFSPPSCNLGCVWCQNHQLSRLNPEPGKAEYTPPTEIVSKAVENGDQGLCVSFTEPTLLHEYNLKCFNLARARGLYSCYVSNGYMTEKALHQLHDAGLTGLKIDVKGDAEVYKEYCGGVKADVVWRNAKTARKMGIHVEVVNLLVTGVNDDLECVSWVVEQHLKNVGPETPLHFNRYTPAYRFQNPPTRIETLERARELAWKKGVLYPYVGNVYGHRYENTYCPKCGRLLVERRDYSVVQYNILPGKKCPECGQIIPITGEYVRK
jgi:pyruvate formate lyase activating enzyme